MQSRNWSIVSLRTCFRIADIRSLMGYQWRRPHWPIM
jgi:hypothetical protein